MSVYKNEKNNTWYVMIRYDDWKGDQHQKCKCGFKSKKEAQDWERSFKLQSAADLDMTFAAFCELYEKDIRPRLKASTWETNENMIQKKLIPAFGKRIISEIDTKDIIAWQNELLAFRDKRKKPYSDTYLKSIHFTAAFNSLFWQKLQAGEDPDTIFRESGIDPDMLGKTRVAGFKGMLKTEVKKGKGFRDITTANDYYAKNMTAEQRIAYLEQQLEYKDQEIEFLKKIVSLTRGDKGC